MSIRIVTRSPPSRVGSFKREAKEVVAFEAIFARYRSTTTMDGQLCHCFRALYLDLDMLQNKVDRGFKALSYLESAGRSFEKRSKLWHFFPILRCEKCRCDKCLGLRIAHIFMCTPLTTSSHRHRPILSI